MAMRRALFLDRDGVINRDDGYVHRIADFVWQDGIFDLARAACKAGLALVVVTNQSGIGRGLYTEAQFAELTAWMAARFAQEKAPLAATYHCPYHPQATVAAYRREHSWRKPAPGMLLAARDALDLDLHVSAMIGDRDSDMEAALAAGIGLRLRLRTGAGAHPSENISVPDLYAARLALLGWLATG